MSFETPPKSLESVCSLITDGSHFSPIPQAEGHPIVNAKDIPNGRINLNSCTRITQHDWELLKKQNCAPQPGDVLLSKDGTIGRVVLYDTDLSVVVLSSVAILRPKCCVHPNFLSHVLRSDAFRRQLLVLESGSALRRIVLKDIRKLEFTFPECTREQSKIAEVLSTVDRAIEQTEALIFKQQRIKTGLMQDLLTRGIDEQGNLRSEESHHFKDSPLGRIPVEWDVRSLASISEFVTSGARGWAKYYSADGAKFLRIGNLTREHINMRLDDVVFVQPPSSAEGMRTLVKQGDILVSITADLGIIAVIPEKFGEGYVNQHIALVRIDDDEVVPRFVGWALQGRAGQAQFERQNDSGAKAGLNLPTIRGLLTPCPPKQEQEHIVKVLDTNTQISEQLRLDLQKQQSLKDALMLDLLTGEKRVTRLLAHSVMT